MAKQITIPGLGGYTRGHHQKLVDVMNIQAWPLSMIHLERLTVLAPMDFLRISARQINPLTRAGCHTTSETWQSSKIRHNIQETSARHGFWWFLGFLGWNFHFKLHWSGKQAMTKNPSYLPGPRKAEIAPCVWASKMRQEYPEDLRKINDFFFTYVYFSLKKYHRFIIYI